VTIITVTNGKGGVGKTSLVANIAGLAAARGLKVLAVDLDPQGNLAADLGLREVGLRDDGSSLLASVRDLHELRCHPSNRSGLEVVVAGHATRDLADWMTAARDEDPTIVASVREAIVADSDHDLIVIDTPPTPSILAEAALIASDFVLVPARADSASVDGIAQVRRSMEDVRRLTGHAPRPLGVVLFDVGTTSTRVISEVRDLVGQEAAWAGGVFPVIIRRSERSALDMRRWGLLAHEYRDRAATAMQHPAARRRVNELGLDDALTRFSRTASALADDYLTITDEVLSRTSSVVV
jgi:cellulose biosynthesis protein BcsQ